MTGKCVRPCDMTTADEAQPRRTTAEERAALRAMRQKLWSLEPLHDALGDHGIHFFDEDDSCAGFSWGKTFQYIGNVIAEARANGDDYDDDLRGVVFFALPDMENLRDGRDFNLVVSLPPGDDGHDAGARTCELAAVVGQKLTAGGIAHKCEGDGVITIPAANLPLKGA